MKIPSLTIAIPFHTGPEYLRQAIASVIAQTAPEWELVVCDDGPEPDIAALVASFADPRLRYYRADQPRGMVANWNRCLDATCTAWVTLLHADDELLPNYVAVMRRATAQAPQAAGIYCEAKIINARGQTCVSFPDWIKQWLRPGERGTLLTVTGQHGLMSLLRGNYIMCPTMCYNLPRLAGRRFAEGWRFAQDLEFFARLLLAGECLVGVPEVAYAYRRHDANATVQYTANLQRFREEAALYEQLRAQAQGWPQVVRAARRKLIIKANLLFCLLTDLANRQWSRAQQKWQFLQSLSESP